MDFSSPDTEKLRRAHPLAIALIERLGPHSGARVVEIACGHGRNTAALRAAGLRVHAVADDAVHRFEAAEPFDAALSTHGFLHGTPDEIEALIASTAAALCAGAPFYATFGSTRDGRYARGTRIAEDTFAPDSGDEAGVPHRYFSEAALRAALGRFFEIESLSEQDVDRIVGRWAHTDRPSGSVHFFAIARKRQ